MLDFLFGWLPLIVLIAALIPDVLRKRRTRPGKLILPASYGELAAAQKRREKEEVV